MGNHSHCFYLEAPRARNHRVANQVPDEILNDPLLNKAIETVNEHHVKKNYASKYWVVDSF